MMLEYQYPGEAATKLPQRVFTYGHTIAPRGLMSFEMLNAHIIITEPWHFPFDVENRKLNHDISRLEIASLCGQQPVDAAQRSLVKKLAGFQEDGIQWGNYGARVRGQIVPVLNRLLQPSTRQAVLNIYDANRDLNVFTMDMPCTLTIQFFVRDDRLITRVSMRSNDVYLGLPYDLHQFCALHCMVAQLLDIEPGEYHHVVGSLHVYEHDDTRVAQMGESWVDLDSEKQKFQGDRDLESMTLFLQEAIDERHMMDARGETPFERWLCAWGT
jgi:thymidylate synthase